MAELSQQQKSHKEQDDTQSLFYAQPQFLKWANRKQISL